VDVTGFDIFAVTNARRTTTPKTLGERYFRVGVGLRDEPFNVREG
jgi:hypothetical protein